MSSILPPGGIPAAIQALPLGTKAIFLLITTVDLISIFLPPTWKQHNGCFGMHNSHLTSFFLAPLMHHDILHYLFNMLAFTATGNALENLMGSMPFIFFNAVLLICTQFAYLFSQYSVHMAASAASSLPNSCVLGYSGVIFGMITYECFSPIAQKEYSICGLVSLPAKVFPFGLLAFCALIFPHSSLLGHCVGVAAGAFISKCTPKGFWDFAVACAPFAARDRRDYRYPQWDLVHNGDGSVPTVRNAVISEGNSGGNNGDSSGGGMASIPVVSSVGALIQGEKNFKAFQGEGRTLGGGGGGGGSSTLRGSDDVV